VGGDVEDDVNRKYYGGDTPADINRISTITNVDDEDDESRNQQCQPIQIILSYQKPNSHMACQRERNIHRIPHQIDQPYQNVFTSATKDKANGTN